MKCPTCKIKKTTDRQLGTVWQHENDCITGKKECENLLPFEALFNPNHPANRKPTQSKTKEKDKNGN